MKKLYLILILLGLTLNFNSIAYADHHESSCGCSAEKVEKKDCDGKSCNIEKKASRAMKYKKGKMDHTQFYLAHAKEIGLDEKQVKSLEAMHVAYESKNAEHKKAADTLQDAFAKKVHDKSLTEADIKQHAKAMGELKTKRLEHRLMHQHASSKVLTEEQNKKVWSLFENNKKDSKKKKRKKRRKRKK